MSTIYSGLARYIDGIPVVPTTAARNSRFASPPPDFRVYNKETHAFEMWNGTAWTTISNAVASPLLYGADPTGTVDSTVAIQAAIDTGLDVDMGGGTYLAHGLTQSVAGQVIYSDGIATIIKNANGDLFTSSGLGAQVRNISFRGDASTPVYTGNNVVASGQNFALLNCGSRYAYARAVKATGGHTQIIGTCDIYQTADASASGYDIELGVSGTATLYHEIAGYYSSQATGGLLTIDTGSTKVQGSQFGKLTVQNGTGPAGVNGGVYVANRIIGDIVVGVSTSLFSSNQCAGNVTFGAATSGHSFDVTNSMVAGKTLTNSGNLNSSIVRNTSTGSSQDWQFGDDTSLALLKAFPASGDFNFPQRVVLANNKALAFRNAAANADAGSLSASAGDNLTIQALVASLVLTAITSLVASINGTTRLTVTTTGVDVVGKLTSTDTATVKRTIGNGTAHVAGDYAASANWGTTPTITPLARDTGGRVTVLAQATTGANPTLTLTFKDGTWTTAPALSYGRGDTAAPTTCFWALTSISATAAVFTFVGTPTAGNTYALDFTVTGK